jgi:lipopolysaccharide/colanic/teichoic acid biosynthesis glycosyltransferase
MEEKSPVFPSGSLGSGANALVKPPVGLCTLSRRISKRSLDVTIALTALFLLSPLLLIIATLIWGGDRKNPIFRQTRTGRHGATFRIYKFRTMRVLEDGAVVQQATRDDARVTTIGRVLRRTSLDELPQLINVLKGDMSLVGPRPHAVAHDEFYGREILSYQHRFTAQPGLTGWAQINGSRGETPTLDHMRRRIALDLWYIENQSLTLDVSIIVRTAWIELTRRANAY